MSITMTTSIEVQSETRPVHVLILGGSYGGMSAAMNFLDMADGKAPRFGRGMEHPLPGHVSSVEVTIVDERDGLCML